MAGHPSTAEWSTEGFESGFDFVSLRPMLHSWAQQCLDRAPLVHRAIAVGDPIERQHEIEHFPWIDRSLDDKLDQLRQIPAHRRRPPVQMDVREEQLPAIEREYRAARRRSPRSHRDVWP